MCYKMTRGKLAREEARGDGFVGMCRCQTMQEMSLGKEFGFHPKYSEKSFKQ